MVYKTVDYPEVIEDSVLTLRKHMILFVPNIILVLISTLLFILFFHLSGLAEMLTLKPYLLDDPIALRESFASLSATPQFAIALLTFLVAEILLSAFFLVMKFGMIRDVVKKGKTTLSSGAEFAEKNYLNFIVVYLAVRAIIYIPLLVLLFIYFMTVRVNEYLFFGQFLMGLFGVIWLFYAIVMTIRLLFVYPVMTFEHDRFFNVIGHEFHYVKTHTTHTLVSFLIVLVVIFAYAFIRESVNIFGFDVQSYVLIIILTILLVALEIAVTTWEHVFIFKSYTESRKIDRLVKGSKSKKGQTKKSTPKKKKSTSKKSNS